MSVYTLNLRVFWPLFTCVLAGLVVLHHIAPRLNPEPGLDPGHEAVEIGCNDQGPSVLFSLAKLVLAFAVCHLFIRFCSSKAGRARRGAPEPTDVHPKSGLSRRELLDDFYDRWVRLSPHVVGHSKANVAKLVGDLVKAGRTDVPPESSLAFRGDFLQVGSSYEEHKVGSPDCFDILVPLRLPRGLRLEPRVTWGLERQERRVEKQGEEKREEAKREEKKEEGKGEEGREGRREERRNKEKSKGKERRVSKREEKRKDKGEESRESKGKGRREDKRGAVTKGEKWERQNGHCLVEKKEEGRMGEKEEVKEVEMEERRREESDHLGAVPRCSLETPRREEWVRKNRAFTETFLRLHLQGAPPWSSTGAMGGGAYRLTPESVLRWFYPAVQRCLTAVRYQYEQRCMLSLTLTEDRLQLRLTPRSDYVCCHISMAIRLLPALPLGDGLYLVPTETPKAPLDLWPNSKDQCDDQRDLWTVFFPRQEQKLLGWLRGHVPQGSCYLKCLQLVKAIRNLGGGALDSQGGALWRSILSSYVLKTAWLRLLLTTPSEAWEERHLVARVEDLLRSLRESLQERSLQHLFLGGGSSAEQLPDSVVLPRLVKEVAGSEAGGAGGNFWAGVPPGALDLVAGRLTYAWSHLHRLIRLGRPQRTSLGFGRAGHGHCLHGEAD